MRTLLGPMKTLMILVVVMCACGDNFADMGPDAAVVEPRTCDGWEAITTDAAEVGEVFLPACPFHTPGISYCARDGSGTWSYHARWYGERLGSYGFITPGTSECGWMDATDERTPATGRP